MSLMQNVSNAELAKLLGEPTGNLLVLDVRTPAEFVGLGHVPNAQNLPVQTISQWAAEIAPDQPLVVVCQHGRRSEYAAQFLEDNGHQAPIYNLAQGMSEWDGDLILSA
jgi:rhodanese-related sulfurtransferase